MRDFINSKLRGVSLPAKGQNPHPLPPWATPQCLAKCQLQLDPRGRKWERSDCAGARWEMADDFSLLIYKSCTFWRALLSRGENARGVHYLTSARPTRYLTFWRTTLTLTRLLSKIWIWRAVFSSQTFQGTTNHRHWSPSWFRLKLKEFRGNVNI